MAAGFIRGANGLVWRPTMVAGRKETPNGERTMPRYRRGHLLAMQQLQRLDIVRYARR
jgi:hypothetical protein